MAGDEFLYTMKQKFHSLLFFFFCVRRQGNRGQLLDKSLPHNYLSSVRLCKIFSAADLFNF